MSDFDIDVHWPVKLRMFKKVIDHFQFTQKDTPERR